MKKAFVFIFILMFILVLLGLFQRCFGSKRLYYDKYFKLYISLEQRVECDEIRIGKSLFKIDSKLLFTHKSDIPTFKIIPQNDTVYIYDEWDFVEETTNGSLVLTKVNWCPKDSDRALIDGKLEYINYHFEDSSALLSTPKRIVFYSEWKVTPYLWNGSYAEEIKRIY